MSPGCLEREQYLLRQLDIAKGISQEFYKRCADYHADKVGVEVFLLCGLND